MNETIDLSIVVPCYNERKNIPLVVDRFQEAMPYHLNIELLLVDNGSTDLSDELIMDLAKQDPRIRLVRIHKNIGYGFGVYSGLKKARGNYICWTHADMQTDIYDTIRAYNTIIQQNDTKSCFIKGNRYGRPIFDIFFTYGMSLFETIMLGTILYDINAQPNLFPKEFLIDITEAPDDFSFDLFFYYLARKKNFKIIRIPVQFKPRVYGQSHWNTSINQKIKFIKRTVAFTIELRKNINKYDKSN